MQQIYRRTLVPKYESNRVTATLLESHFGMGVLLQICCVFSEHIFLRTTLESCFLELFYWYSQDFMNINPFQANAPFLYPLKTSENHRFSGVFRGYRNGELAGTGLICHLRKSSNKGGSKYFIRHHFLSCKLDLAYLKDQGQIYGPSLVINFILQDCDNLNK